ncbi:hypothetical protein L6R53_04925 [Myxococcota bacterium]|nr:hypothetical protein [Myxococcota bacterium]
MTLSPLLLLALASPPARAEDALFGPDGPSWGALSGKGYIEVRFSFTDAEGTPWQLTERLRPTGAVQITDRVSLEGTVDASIQQGRHLPDEARAVLEQGVIDGSGFESLDDALEYVGCSLDTTRRYDQVGDVASIERLHLDVQVPAVDLRLGRQGVSWGSARVVNPTDVFAEYILAEPWRERAGVDAARATVPLGERALITAVGGFDDLPAELRDAGDESLGQDWQAVAWKAGLRGTVSRGPVDVSMVAFEHRSGQQHRELVGLDVRGDHEVGWWVEGAWDGSLVTGDPSWKGDVKVAAGVDYSFLVAQGLAVAAQVFYDGSGASPEDMDYQARSAQGAEFDFDCEDGIPDELPVPDTSLASPVAPYRATYGRVYGLLQARQTVTTDWVVDATALVNLEDATGLLFPSTSVYLGRYVTLSAGAQVLVGQDGEFAPPEEALIDGSFDFNPLVPRWTALTWGRFNF